MDIEQNRYLSSRRVGCRICIGREMVCASCSGKSNFVCLNKQDGAIRTSSWKNRGGSVECSLGRQLAFSGTDKHLIALNSWYEVENLRQDSLYGLFSNLKNSLTNQYNDFFQLWGKKASFSSCQTFHRLSSFVILCCDLVTVHLYLPLLCLLILRKYISSYLDFGYLRSLQLARCSNLFFLPGEVFDSSIV